MSENLADSHFNGTHYVSSSELKGLVGGYHLFNMRSLPKVIITPLRNDLFQVEAFNRRIVLNPDDCFGIDPEKRKLYRIYGPSQFPSDPYRQLIAISRLGQSSLHPLSDYEELLNNPLSEGMIALGFDSLEKEHKQITQWKNITREKLEKQDVVVILREKEQVKRIIGIFVGLRAGKEGLEWLTDYLVSEDCIRPPSGVFSFVSELV